MPKYVISPYMRRVSAPGLEAAMVYHALYGNPRVVNKEGLRFLEFFKEPKTAETIGQFCDGDPEGAIREFTKIFFLVESELDEKELLYKKRDEHLRRVSRRQTVDRMGLAISDSCNFGCTHCIHFQPSTASGAALPLYQKPRAQLMMSWETAKTCIDCYAGLVRENGSRHCKIHFGNAEPLINWSVIEKVLKYSDTIKDLRFEFAINTNLVLLTRGIAEILKRYGVRIATSLDGTRDANDAIRVTRGGRGTFDRILTKFDLLAGIGYPLDGFSVTVTKRNFDLIDIDIIDLAAERGMSSIAFDYDLVGLVGVPVATRVDKLMHLKQYANKQGIDFFGTWDSVFRNLTSESLLNGSHAFCAAVEGRSLEFNVDGSIKACSHTTTKVGHLKRFDQMFQNGGGLIQLVKERLPGTNDYCSGCVIEGPCGGQCHVTREVISRAAGETRQRLFADMCDFYRVVTEALAMEYLRAGGATAIASREYCTL